MAVDAFHHRSTTKANNKSFKSRKATKGTLKEQLKGRVNERTRKSPYQYIMSKADRKNHAKQLALQKQKNADHEAKQFAGKNGSPRIISVVAFGEEMSDNNLSISAVHSLLESVDEKAESGEVFKSYIERFKRNIVLIPLYQKSLGAVLDACQTSDFVLFVTTEAPDDDAQHMMSCICAQGVSNIFAAVKNLGGSGKQQTRQLEDLKARLLQFFPLDKIFNLDTRNECSNLIRSLCSTVPKGIRWRDDRSWMFADSVQQEGGELLVSGVVRSKPLSANSLIYLGSQGPYRVRKITAPDGGILAEPDENQESLQELAEEDIIMDNDLRSTVTIDQKGVLLDDHHYFSEEEDEVEGVKKVPKGTSTYQSAWYLGDETDSEDERSTDGEEEEPVADEDIMDAISVRPEETIAPTEMLESEMFLDPAPEDEEEQIAEFRAARLKEAKEDLEFPDEIELHPHTLARERLAKYRGLKSVRVSPWAVEEDAPFEPEEWRRLLQIQDYKSSKNKCFRAALVGPVKPGTRVVVHIEAATIPDHPLVMVALLSHEQKRTAMNFTITVNSGLEEPLKAKEELYMQCGFRRLKIQPIYSENNITKNNVHKFFRYIHSSQTAVATVVAPLIWGTTPALFFKKTEDNLVLIGTGSSLPPDHSRVVAKRAVLTGHPYKIHRKLVTVRYMFFNSEDIAWFKALPLWTRRGRSGFIKESLGTHGYFKATFDGKINPQDSVAVSLYKRVFPKEATAW